MKSATNLILLVLLLSTLSCSTAFSADMTKSEAKQLIERNYKAMEAMKSKTSHINLYFVTLFWDSLKYHNSRYSVDMQMVNGYSHVTSGTYEMYQSEKEAIILDHIHKSIFRRGIGRNELPVGFSTDMFNMTDSLLSKLDVQSCRSIQEDGDNRFEIVLVPSPSLRNVLQYSKFTFVFHASDQSIQRIFIEYTKASIIKVNLVLYNTFDIDGRTLTDGDKDQISNAFGRHSSLLTKYKDYHVKDLRKE